MSLTKSIIGMCGLLVAVLLITTASSADYSSSLTAGRAELQSAGPLAFGPEGILFVGDSMGAAIFALATEERTPDSVR